MDALFSTSELDSMISGGFVNVQKHPNAELYIYNYSPKTQYEKAWNEVTLNCRGLIMDGGRRIVARPFRKFFNLSEHASNEIPQEGFEVYEKMDGSMGILYWLDGIPYIASRGSFDSNQARKANQILNGKYSHTFGLLDKSKTYLFEIIYPENRIVCDYGKTEDLVMLAVIDTETGKDCDLPDIGFPVVKRHDRITDISQLLSENPNDREGYVVRFRSGFRVKVKFEEYCRLHRIITQVSNKTIWEYLSQAREFDEMLDKVPDEFYGWVKSTRNNILGEYAEIEKAAKSHYRHFDDRKQAAEHFLKTGYAPILFSMMDGKDYSRIIWRMVKPSFEKPFVTNGEQ